MNENANEIVAAVIRALDHAGIAHMLVGSLSSNSYGVERATKDADFVIELGERSIGTVGDALAPDIRLDRQISFESVTLTRRYEAHHVASEFGIEFFLLADEPFHQERFRRRRKMRFGCVDAFIPTPEDVVVQKIRWYARAKRAKDRDDVLNVLAVQKDNLDFPYIRRWCDEHGTRESFETILRDVPDV